MQQHRPLLDVSRRRMSAGFPQNSVKELQARIPARIDKL